MTRPLPTPEDLDRRVRRRETRSARSGLVVLVASVLLVGLVYAALEAGTRALDHEAWLIAPDAAWAWFVGLPGTAEVRVVVIVIGALVALVGLGLLVAAFAPGRRDVRELPASRIIALVDDEVLAQALVRSAQLAAGVGSDQVRVVVDRRGVAVQVRPTSGVPVDAEAVRSAVERDLERQGLDASTPVTVTLASTGVVGQ